MNIAIIGTGNVGSALASAWSRAGHTISLGVREKSSFKGKELLKNKNTSLHSIIDAVQKSDVILISTPAMNAVEVAKSLGDTSHKVIIDSMNIIQGRGPEGFTNTSDAILAHTQTKDLVKCFNTTGANNMLNPEYHGAGIDAFVAGDSLNGKSIAKQLALDVGFGECYDVGGNDKFQLMEQFAFFWINLAMFQGQAREIAFKLFHR
jgi:predicted dinucleotide-binding enzyme